MALGIIPTRDWRGWTRQTIDLTSTCSAKKGSLVKLGTARTLAEYTSVDSQYLGVIAADSANSTPTGKAVVLIPNGGARAIVDVPTGLASSALSLGQCYGIYRGASPDGAPCSTLTDGSTSVWSRTVTITGTLDNSSGVSRIEVAFIQNGATFDSVSSTSLA